VATPNEQNPTTEGRGAKVKPSTRRGGLAQKCLTDPRYENEELKNELEHAGLDEVQPGEDRPLRRRSSRIGRTRASGAARTRDAPTRRLKDAGRGDGKLGCSRA